MIDVEQVWVPQVLWYCDLVADRAKLISAFNQTPDKRWTSVIGYDELSCQIFDDLSSLDHVSALGDSTLPQGLRQALGDFVHALNAFDHEREQFCEDDLQTAEWSAVEQSAIAALAAAKTWKTNAQTH